MIVKKNFPKKNQTAQTSFYAKKSHILLACNATCLYKIPYNYICKFAKQTHNRPIYLSPK